MVIGPKPLRLAGAEIVGAASAAAAGAARPRAAAQPIAARIAVFRARISKFSS
jgi:hypothetical protein